MLITIEGVDCSGKETQSKLLEEKLIKNGKKVARFSFPFYDSPTGKIIARPYLGKDNNSFFEEGASKVDPYVASLYFVADRKYNINVINEALENNDVVILDRYVYSNMAHQGCKLDEKTQDDFFSFIYKLEFELLKLPKPDLAFFLYLPINLVQLLKSNRKERPDDHEKDFQYLQKAEKTYMKLVDKFNFKQINCSNMDIIRSPEEICDEMFEIMQHE